MEVIPIEKLPEIVSVAQPSLPAEIEEAIEEKRRFIAERPALWDGPVWWVAAASAETITVFEASYAWVLAAETIAEFAPQIGHGNLSVELLLSRGGDRLWQRRALQIADGGGTWTYSASGVLAPGDDPFSQMRVEAEEELHLPAEALRDLQPFAISRGRTFTGIFFAAELADGFVPQAGGEVEAFVWSPTPDPLAPTFGALRDVWPLLSELV